VSGAVQSFPNSSTILPLLVRGMSTTCMILAGTWRGVVLARIWPLIFWTRASSSWWPGRSRTERTMRVSFSHSWPMTRLSFDFVDLFDLAIDLGRADAHAARVQCRVRAAVDNDAVMLGELDIIAVAPDVGEPLEIGGAILLVVAIVPEADGHAGKGRGADQLAHYAKCPARWISFNLVRTDRVPQGPL
jgi:hypothetical protein